MGEEKESSSFRRRGSAAVAVYGMSADPPTDVGGHGSVVRALVKTGSFDEILIVPVYEHAFAHKRENMRGTASYEARCDMCALAFDGARAEGEEKDDDDDDGDDADGGSKSARIVVSQAERRVSERYARGEASTSKPGSTAALMALLRMEKPDADFVICIGEDAFDDLLAGKWHKGEELLRDYSFIVAPRHGYESRREHNVGNAGIATTDGALSVSWLETAETAPMDEGKPVSSTVIRSALERRSMSIGGESDPLTANIFPSKALHERVLAYIVRHGLYRDAVFTFESDSTTEEPTPMAAVEKVGSPKASKTSSGYFSNLSKKFSTLSTGEPSAYFSRDKSFADVKDKNGLLAESRPLVGKEVDVHNALHQEASHEEFLMFKALPYCFLERAIRTELQNNPPGKTWNATKAKKYAHMAMERLRVVNNWRRENEVEAMLEEGILPHSDAMYTHWPAYVHGYDAYGHPIMSERPKDIYPDGLKSSMTIPEIMRHRIQMMETMEYVKSRSEVAHTVYKHNVFIDLEGVTLSFMTGEVKTFMTELVKLLTHRYSDSLHLLYIINTPIMFRVVWSMLQPLLSTTTKSKIFMFGVGPNQSKKLQKQLAKHDIPLSSAPKCCGGGSQGTRFDDFIRKATEMYARIE